jgi:hypothetical protein
MPRFRSPHAPGQPLLFPDAVEPAPAPVPSSTLGERPEPAGPYRTNVGPIDGPILAPDCHHAIGVYEAPSAADGALGMPIGMAMGVGEDVDGHGQLVRTFRVVIGKAELPGLYVCVCRVFMPLGR